MLLLKGFLRLVDSSFCHNVSVRVCVVYLGEIVIFTVKVDIFVRVLLASHTHTHTDTHTHTHVPAFKQYHTKIMLWCAVC